MKCDFGINRVLHSLTPGSLRSQAMPTRGSEGVGSLFLRIPGSYMSQEVVANELIGRKRRPTPWAAPIQNAQDRFERLGHVCVADFYEAG